MGSNLSSKVDCNDIRLYRKYCKSRRRPAIKIDKSQIGIPTDFRVSDLVLYYNYLVTDLFCCHSIHTMLVNIHRNVYANRELIVRYRQ